MQSRRPLQIRPEQPTPRLYKLPRPVAKDCKNTGELKTYLAYFSVTYLATSLKLAKFSVTRQDFLRLTAQLLLGQCEKFG